MGLLAVSTQVIAPQDLSATPPGEVGRPDASAVEVPAGTEFDQARPATDPVIPAEETRPGGEAVSGVAPPADPGTTPPAFDTSSLEMPQPVEAPGSLGELPRPAAEVSVDVTGPGETAPQIAPVGPLAAPQNGAPAPATDTAAPNIAPPAETEAPAIEPTAADAGGDVPAVPGLAAEPDMPSATAGGDAPTSPEGADAPTAMTAPRTSEPPVVALADASATPPGAEAPARPGDLAASPGAATAPTVGSAPATPETPVLAQAATEVPAAGPASETPSGDAAPDQVAAPSGEAAPSGDSAPDAVAPITSAEAMTPDAGPPVDAAPGTPEPAATGAPSGDVAPDQMAAPSGDAAPDTIEPVATAEAGGDAATAAAEAPGKTGEGGAPFKSGTAADTPLDPDSAAPEAAVEAPRIRPAPGAGGTLPRVIRLVGEDEPQEAPEATPDEPETPVDPGAGALERFSVASGAGFGDAILSLVILHEGGLPDPARLAGLPRGLSFAVDAGQPDAEAVARAYRAAGREVVLIPSLPERARPQDVEQAMQANLRAVPEAVAVMDTTGGGFQSDRQAVAQVVDAIGATGHGLITFPRGLNTAHQRAEREGVPRGLIFRDIDGQGESGDEIGRSLDRAAFRARQSRQPVILVGRGLDATLSAVTDWAAAKGSDGVILAPVSAALLAGN